MRKNHAHHRPKKHGLLMKYDGPKLKSTGTCVCGWTVTGLSQNDIIGLYKKHLSDADTEPPPNCQHCGVPYDSLHLGDCPRRFGR